MRIAKVLEQFDMLWLEIDMYDHEAIRQIKDSTTTKICTGENLYYMREYLPYFECRAADVFMIDVPWNGSRPQRRSGIWRMCSGSMLRRIITIVTSLPI